MHRVACTFRTEIKYARTYTTKGNGISFETDNTKFFHVDFTDGKSKFLQDPVVDSTATAAGVGEIKKRI